MPFGEIPGVPTRYALIAFDRKGREVRDDSDGVDGRMSEELLRRVRQQPPRSIFLFSHGWKGDVPAAVDQYNRWIKALLDRSPDLASAHAAADILCIGLPFLKKAKIRRTSEK
jgi:hypothetical protein